MWSGESTGGLCGWFAHALAMFGGVTWSSKVKPKTGGFGVGPVQKMQAFVKPTLTD